MPLDYSVASLRVVDGIVEGFQRGAHDQEQLADALFGFGAHVGEALVRQAGGERVDFDAVSRRCSASRSVCGYRSDACGTHSAGW